MTQDLLRNNHLLFSYTVHLNKTAQRTFKIMKINPTDSALQVQSIFTDNNHVTSQESQCSVLCLWFILFPVCIRLVSLLSLQLS